MIVECENCKLRYEIDEHLIKDGGSKVRCSNCKNVFMLYKPSPEEVTYHEANVSEEAVLPPPGPESLEPSKAQLTPPAETPAEDDLDFEDLEFDEELGPAEAGPEAGGLPPESEPGQEVPEFGDLEEELGLDQNFDLGEAEEAPAEAGEAGDMEFVDLDQALGLEEGTGPSAGEVTLGDAGDQLEELVPGEETEEDLLVEEELEAEPAAENEPADFGQLNLEETPGPEKESGFPGSLFEDEAEVETGKPAVSLEDTAIRAPAVEEEEEEEDEEELRFEDVAEGEAEALASEFHIPPQKKGRPVLWVAVALLAVLAVLAGLFFFMPDLFVPSEQTASKATDTGDAAGNKSISVGSARHFFQQNEKEGQLLVITGLATNRYPNARSYIRLKGLLTDEKGKVLIQKMVYCGNVLNDEDLQSKSLEEITKVLDQRQGRDNANVNIEPGKSVIFMLVFKMSKEMAEFTVEVVSSEPVKPQEKPT